MNDRQQGFALLIVLMTLGFLALLGTQLVAAARSDTRLADNLKQEAVLEAAADGAVANVMFAMQAARNPQFQADGTPRTLRIGNTAVSVKIENETDRINLNTASAVLLRALLVQVGAAPALAERLAVAIFDWRRLVPMQGTVPRRLHNTAPPACRTRRQEHRFKASTNLPTCWA